MNFVRESIQAIIICVALTGSIAAPSTEWTFHKTADGSHPSGREQEMVWLMNRAREQPAWEGRFLALCEDSNVAFARTYFGVDTDLMISEFAGYPARPPAAFDLRLYVAASNHTADLIYRNAQDHTDQFTRISDAGFHFSTASGSVYSYTKYPLHAHAGFNIDWGSTPDGMQVGRGHRMGLMSATTDYLSNVGISMEDVGPTNTIGPIVTSINYAKALTSYGDHYNRFLVGTVWDDANANGMYDDGEGKAGVSVTPDVGTFYAITADSGGWALPATVSGTYVVTFSGAAIGADVVVTAEVGTVSVRIPWPGTETTALGTPKYWYQSYGTFSGFDSADSLNSDSDAMTDAQEYVAGTVPTNGNSFFEITESESGSQPVISWPSLSGRTYNVLSSTNLTGGTWSSAPGGVDLPGIDGTMSYTNSAGTDPCYFRINVSAP